ncbi:Uncharacterised protein [uncultured archaeon]|nr:Uncharacterised protein [uncultured archaeon]
MVSVKLKYAMPVVVGFALASFGSLKGQETINKFNPKLMADNANTLVLNKPVSASKLIDSLGPAAALPGSPGSISNSNARRPVAIDSAYLQMLRAAFLDEINQIRSEQGAVPLREHRRFNSVAQKYSDTLATLPAGQISHDVTEQSGRLSWLLPYSRSARECIHVEAMILPASLSDTADVIKAVRNAARKLFQSKEHAPVILMGSNGSAYGLGGVGISFKPESGGYSMVAVLEVGGQPTPTCANSF